MPRLLRPHIPLEVRLRVALRQLGFVPTQIDAEVLDAKDPTRAPQYRGVGRVLKSALAVLAERLGCQANDLQLDHDPALENREKLVLMPSGRRVRRIVVPAGGQVLRYFPAANDPAFLIYRPKHAHHIKTNVRGDGAQYPDRVLAKRERRRAQRQAGKPSRFKKTPSRAKRIPSRQSRGRGFPPKGSRPFSRRRKP